MKRVFALLIVAVTAVATTACQPPPPKACNVAVIGDSLSVGAQPWFNDHLKRHGCTLAWYDAKVSRRTSDAMPILEAHNKNNTIPYALIVGLGTNDRYELDGFAGRVDRVIQIANGRQIIWINTSHLPVRDRVNAILADRARRHSNFHVIDWNTAYWANPSWRASDQIHGTPHGYNSRAALMADTLHNVTK